MSCKVEIDSLEWEIRQKINDELKIKLETNKYNKNAPSKYIFPYEIVGDYINLPFSYAYKELRLTRPTRNMFPVMNQRFIGELRPEQIIVHREAIDLLSRNGGVVISCFPGFGKTIGSISLACTVKFKTLVIVNKIVLMKQWEESINKFCPTAKVQLLKPKTDVQEDADFYVVNAINVEKMDRQLFSSVGTLICDEIHQLLAETLSRSLLHINPRYVIGLSATPKRYDGLDVLFDLYFGKHKIVRTLVRKHTVYRVNTDLTPPIELAKNGKVNWGSILDSQANDVDRNELIIKIAQYFSDRTFLILTKRLSQGAYLVDRFTELGENVTSLLGSQQEFDINSRILIGTNSKVGTGFDHPRLDALILACDLEQYFIQFLGRCMRTQEVEPIIFDFVDDNKILENHFRTRRSVYLEHGGKIKIFDRSILPV